jgi:hypothetical protein
MITRQDLIDMGYGDGPVLTDAMTALEDHPNLNDENRVSFVQFVFDRHAECDRMFVDYIIIDESGPIDEDLFDDDKYDIQEELDLLYTHREQEDDGA